MPTEEITRTDGQSAGEAVTQSAGTLTQTVEPAAPAQPAAGGPPPVKKPKKRRVRRIIRRVITLLVVLALLGGISYAVWYFLFREEEVTSQILPATATTGSIQMRAEGSGSARAKESAAVTIPADGVIQDVYVSEGQLIMEGQPLYTLDSPAAREAVAAAQAELERLNGELTKLQDSLGDLTVRAPFAGKIMDARELAAGDPVSAGETVCTLVNDRVLKMALRFSYAYENSIYTGQTVQVSVPATMSLYTGRVERINKISYVSPEGGVFFEVIITLNNPGTLTEGMEATASMTAADGSPIYPYENGTLSFYERVAVTATASGPVTRSNLLNYAQVSAGQALLTLGDTQISEDMRAKREEIAAAEQKLAEAEAALVNSDALAPISGTITSCFVTPGMEVKAGTTVITISNTAEMIVEITVDDRNIPYVTPGKEVELSDWNGNYFVGTVTNIDMNNSTSSGMGMTSYPVTLTVDNFDGRLMQGMWLTYSFVTSEAVDCVMVPIQCVKSLVDTDGNEVNVVFVQSDTRPENAIDVDLPEPVPGRTPDYPTPEEGYWPVPVETGLNDRYNLEIVSGLEDGAVVFNAYVMTGAYSY